MSSARHPSPRSRRPPRRRRTPSSSLSSPPQPAASSANAASSSTASRRAVHVVTASVVVGPSRHHHSRRGRAARVSSDTLSMCGVCGNMSTGVQRTRLVAVLVAQHREVRRERGRVARDVDDARRLERAGAPQRLSGEPGPRRIDDDHVRRARVLAQLLDRLPDVAREERRVRDPVQPPRSRSRTRPTPRRSRRPRPTPRAAASARPIVPVPQ